MENLHVKIEGEQKELVIREGDALPAKEPMKVAIAGDINAVTEFLTKRKIANGTGLQKVDPTSAVIEVDEEKMFIMLHLDPENHYGATVTGRLEFTKELTQFDINGKGTFGRDALLKLIRFNGLLFKDKDKHAALLAAYQAFNMQAHIQANTESDLKGNKSGGFQKKL